MRIVVLGGGVVGVTTAYQLQKDGHEVVCSNATAGAAGTSWGNAGMIAPGHSFVWSSPGRPDDLLKSLVFKDQALRFSSPPIRGCIRGGCSWRSALRRRRGATRCSNIGSPSIPSACCIACRGRGDRL